MAKLLTFIRAEYHSETNKSAKQTANLPINTDFIILLNLSGVDAK